MEYFIWWIILSILVGVYANKKKTRIGGFITGFFLSLLFSPLIGFLIILLSKVDEDVILKEGEVKRCPKCAELIKAQALKCRYCGEEFIYGKEFIGTVRQLRQ